MISNAQPRIFTPKTPLQRHVGYFDGNKDGKITTKETREGLEKLGLTGAPKWLGAAFINYFMGPMTSKKLTSTIDLEHIERGKHDSDSDIFDAEGNLDQKQFDTLFARYDADKNGALDANEFAKMRAERGQKKLGKVASSAEFGLLTKLVSDAKVRVAGKDVNALSRQRLQDFYEGTLFDKVAAERAAKPR